MPRFQHIRGCLLSASIVSFDQPAGVHLPDPISSYPGIPFPSFFLITSIGKQCPFITSDPLFLPPSLVIHPLPSLVDLSRFLVSTSHPILLTSFYSTTRPLADRHLLVSDPHSHQPSPLPPQNLLDARARPHHPRNATPLSVWMAHNPHNLCHEPLWSVGLSNPDHLSKSLMRWTLIPPLPHCLALLLSLPRRISSPNDIRTFTSHPSHSMTFVPYRVPW